MATLSDIARATGVSKMTVSNALRGKSNVSEETRRRILEAARQLNYQANLAARALSSGRNGILELIVQDLDSPFYGRLAKELSLATEQTGMQMLVRQTYYSETTEKNALSFDQSLLCDGLILATPRISSEEAKQLAQHRPLILIDDCTTQRLVSTVNTPNYEGARQAMLHLIETGATSPLILGASPDEWSVVAEGGHIGTAGGLRLAGAYQAAQESGLAIAPSACIPLEWTVDTARKAIHDIAASSRHFDALFCMSDNVAIGAMRGLADCGAFRIPQDVSIIGFDGSAWSAASTPSLSTIAIDMPGMAQTIIRRLCEQLTVPDGGVITTDIAGFTLQARESTSRRTSA